MIGKGNIDKNLDLGLMKEVQWAGAEPDKLRAHLDKAEERLGKLPHSESVTHLKSYLAQARKLLDEAKIPSSKLTPERLDSFVGKLALLDHLVDHYVAYDGDALRKASSRIDILEKRIQKASDIAGWESKFKGSVHAADLFVAEKFKVDERTVENWRAEWRKDGWKQPTRSDIKSGRFKDGKWKQPTK